MTRRAALAFALTALTLVGPASAQGPKVPTPRGWPQPAAGASASGETEILLTFDDGPDADTTRVVLDLLRDRGIRAVFFQVGWRFRRGDVAKAQALEHRIIREGHIVGNHTINHVQLCSVDRELGRAEVEGSRALLEQATGMPVPWFRTPYGARCPRVERLLGELGLQHFHWDIDPQEWRGLGAKATAARVIHAINRIDGRGVLLMHDTKFATRFALPEVLKWIDAENVRRRKRGRPGIRIIGGDQVAAEQIAPTLAWLRAAIGHGRAGVDAALVATVP
ncbi:MAG: polysaccharide deacetylase family protein [Myxococcales bacterium]|nr:polysaccharide deacetylase family protein [Myxococcales bacterium]